MNKYGLREGGEFAVVVYYGRGCICEVTGEVISETEVVTSVYTEGSESLLLANEVLRAVASAVDFHMHKPSLKRMLEARIAELKALDEEGAEDNPPPPSINDIPF